MNYLVTHFAEQDLTELLEYLESQRPGHAAKFIARYEKAVQEILDAPNSWPKYYANTRIRLIKRQKKHGVVYQVRGDTIYILGVLSLVRKPGYWKHRLKERRHDVEE